MIQDNGVERISPALPRSYIPFGCTLALSSTALSSTSLVVDVRPGLVVIEDHALQFGGRTALNCAAGMTLADGNSVYSDAIAYYVPSLKASFVSSIAGAQAVTPVAPSDADIKAALPADTRWTRLGRTKFSRSGSVVTLVEISHLQRPLEVDPLEKLVASSVYQELTPGASSGMLVFSHTETFTVDAADIANGDVLTDKRCPAFQGAIRGFRATTSKAITTAARTATLNLEIGATNLTGGSLVVAGTKALGTVTEATAITAANTFKPGDVYSIEAASVTAFAEGRLTLEVDFWRYAAN